MYIYIYYKSSHAILIIYKTRLIRHTRNYPLEFFNDNTFNIIVEKPQQCMTIFSKYKYTLYLKLSLCIMLCTLILFFSNKSGIFLPKYLSDKINYVLYVSFSRCRRLYFKPVAYLPNSTAMRTPLQTPRREQAFHVRTNTHITKGIIIIICKWPKYLPLKVLLRDTRKQRWYTSRRIK